MSGRDYGPNFGDAAGRPRAGEVVTVAPGGANIVISCPHCHGDVEVSVAVSGGTPSSNGSRPRNTQIEKQFFTLKGHHISPDRDDFLAFAKTNPSWHSIRDFYAVVDDHAGQEIRVPVRQLFVGGLKNYDENIPWESTGITTNDAMRILGKLGIRDQSFRHVAD